MGMFNWVKYADECDCGEPLTEFQSKDGACDMEELDPSEVSYFYAYCNKCKKMINYNVERCCTVKNITRKTNDD